MSEKIKKGSLLIVKIPPYYRQEYFYEVTSAGTKVIKASLYHSPKVRRSWSIVEINLLIDIGIVRLASEHERPR